MLGSRLPPGLMTAEISVDEINNGPPPPWTKWEAGSIAAFLRGKAISLDRVVSYGKRNGVYVIFYEPPQPDNDP